MEIEGCKVTESARTVKVEANDGFTVFFRKLDGRWVLNQKLSSAPLFGYHFTLRYKAHRLLNGITD